jgi:hypothetical protein
MYIPVFISLEAWSPYGFGFSVRAIVFLVFVSVGHSGVHRPQKSGVSYPYNDVL